MTKTISYTHEAPLTGGATLSGEEDDRHNKRKKGTTSKKIGAVVAAAGLVGAGFLANKAVDHFSKNTEVPRLSSYELANVTEIAVDGVIDSINALKDLSDPKQAEELGYSLYSDSPSAGNISTVGLDFTAGLHREGSLLFVSRNMEFAVTDGGVVEQLTFYVPDEFKEALSDGVTVEEAEAALMAPGTSLAGAVIMVENGWTDVLEIGKDGTISSKRGDEDEFGRGLVERVDVLTNWQSLE